MQVSIEFGGTNEDRKDYIVYMGSLPEGDYSPPSHHLSILQEVVEASSVASLLIRSYYRSFNGFSARLTIEEQQKLASMKEVVSVFPSRTLQLQTTRSWDFMGFIETVARKLTVESDIIMGVIDTGIWPESKSFNDEGFGPPPNKWRGTCHGGKNFTCNNKIIGARYFSLDVGNSTRDVEGHGSHTASIAAGNKVSDISFYGMAEGKGRGAVPSARVAAYKVCSEDGCQDKDILSAFDHAIADGVDIITISIGSDFPIDFAEDSIAIGAFHAMDKGILTVNAAGNSGPEPSSVSSVAPWMLSVAASSIDRKIVDKVILGNGSVIVGKSVNSFTLNGTKFPLIDERDAVCNFTSVLELTACCDGCLDSSLAKGKIVVCFDLVGAGEAFRAGAAGSIMFNRDDDYALVVPFPTSSLSDQDYSFLRTYMQSTETPQATILRSEVRKDNAAPVVASFSSRGPNNIAPEILKPDISAPGVDILAAYSPVASPSFIDGDTRSVMYNILSGTSMSCPHAAGAAAYVKSFHINWSPSAIKSALMTTAFTMDATKHEVGEFAYGAGHINPVKAVDPGLVYEAFKDDYVRMLCSMRYNANQIKAIAGSNTSCPRNTRGSPKDLNYPSMAVLVKNGKPFTVKITRTVRNVGLANSTYKSEVTAGSNINITVQPSVLSFQTLNEKQSFVVLLTGGALPESSTVTASLVWSDNTHSVRSPIVVSTSGGPFNR